MVGGREVYPRFNGKADDVLDWLENFRAVGNANGDTSVLMMNKVRFYLDEATKQWWLLAMSDLVIRDMADVDTLFKDHFHAQERLLKKLTGYVYSEGDCLEQYCNKIIIDAKKLEPPVHKRIVKEYISRGLTRRQAVRLPELRDASKELGDVLETAKIIDLTDKTSLYDRQDAGTKDSDVFKSFGAMSVHDFDYGEKGGYNVPGSFGGRRGDLRGGFRRGDGWRGAPRGGFRGGFRGSPRGDFRGAPRDPNKQFKWTEDGKPICDICGKVGHVRRQCQSRAHNFNSIEDVTEEEWKFIQQESYFYYQEEEKQYSEEQGQDWPAEEYYDYAYAQQEQMFEQEFNVAENTLETQDVKPLVKVKFGPHKNIVRNALIDTGTPLNIVKEDLVRGRGRRQSGCMIRLGDGRITRSKGVIELEILIKDKYYKVECEVIENLPQDMFLETRFLKEYKFVVDIDGRCLKNDNDQEKIAFSRNKFRVTSDVDVMIPPHSECCFAVSINAPNDTLVMVNGNEASTKVGISVAKSVGYVKRGESLARVVNLSKVPKVLKANETFGVAEMVSRVKSDFQQISKNDAGDYVTMLEGEEVKVDINPDLIDKDKESIKNIILKYPRLFSKNRIGTSNVGSHKIELEPNSRPINCPPRRFSETKRMAAKEEVKNMLKQKVIQNSRSPWCAGVVMVQKKKLGQWRLCIDYRGLNKITKRDVYPMPNMVDLLSALNGAKLFSSLDVKTGFWQIFVDEADREKTAFATEDGFFEWLKMPMGLSNSSSTFQRTMDIILSGLKWITCLVYIDDVLIFGNSVAQHNARLDVVLNRINSSEMTIGLDKCKFGYQKLNFLGFEIDENGISMDPAKVQSVKNWEMPKDVKGMQRFLGFTNCYRRLIPRYADIAEPLYKLTRDKEKYLVTEKEMVAFNELKTFLQTNPVIVHPNLQGNYILETDASSHGISGILKQEHGTIEFFSRSLSSWEKNYTATELEALAIVASVKHFQQYLDDSEFMVITDHKACEQMQNWKNENKLLNKFGLYLQDYNCKIVYREGKLNTEADALSRIGDLTGFDKNHWKLNPKYYTNAEERWGQFDVDMFASKENRQCKTYISKYFEEQAIGRDAFCYNWSKFVNPYGNLPFDKIRDGLDKIRKEKVEHVVLVLPIWMNEKWWKDCMKLLVDYPIILEDQDDVFFPESNNYSVGIGKMGFKVMIVKLSGLMVEQRKFNDKLHREELDKDSLFDKKVTVGAIDPIRMSFLQKQDGNLAKYFRGLPRVDRDKNGIKFEILNNILFRNKLVNDVETRSIMVPECLKTELLKQSHDDHIFGGHFGVYKTVEKIKAEFFWKGMHKEVEEYCKTCVTCQRVKTPNYLDRRGMLQPIKVCRRLELIGIDYIERLKTTKEGFKHIAVITDYFSKLVVIIPTKTKKSSELAPLLIEKFFLIYGFPEAIVSDRGKYFLGKMMHDIYNIMKIDKRHTTSFHPRTDGLVERFNKTLCSVLAKYINSEQDNWDEFLGYIAWSYNTAVQESTKMSPFFMNFKEIPRFSTNNIFPMDGIRRVIWNEGDLLLSRLQQAARIAKGNLDQSQNRQERNFNKNRFVVTYKVGDEVMVQNTQVGKGKKVKFFQTWFGPYIIKEQKSSTTYRLQTKDGQVTWPVLINVERLKLFHKRDGEEIEYPITFSRVLHGDASSLETVIVDRNMQHSVESESEQLNRRRPQTRIVIQPYLLKQMELEEIQRNKDLQIKEVQGKMKLLQETIEKEKELHEKDIQMSEEEAEEILRKEEIEKRKQFEMWNRQQLQAEKDERRRVKQQEELMLERSRKERDSVSKFGRVRILRK